MNEKIRTVCEQFELSAPLLKEKLWGSGHIHDTYLIELTNHAQFILQRMNGRVFPGGDKINQSIDKICKHLAKQIPNYPLFLVPTYKREPFYEDEDKDIWRIFPFIKSDSYDFVTDASQAYSAAKCLGQFQKGLIDFPPETCHIAIPDFHSLPWRFRQFEEAIRQHKLPSRKEEAKNEIEFVRIHEHLRDKISSLVETNELPLRVTHNDPKLSNFLFEPNSYEAICLIDMDTIMPGTVIYDFGDMVRSMCCPYAEDEQDLSKINVDLEIFEALVKGYINETKHVLHPAELDHLILGAVHITFIMGLRFLTDYLSGDVYYKTAYPEQNIRRSRNQFALVSSMEAKHTEMKAIVAKYR